ncbi:ArdC family protein [Chromobacterium haemolyticum]|uniref:ArdC family protein n=1 Tax=Chromobacterium haemolyticum TaxID=394935 RepID=UPI00244968C3|nr:zincin-like metallopeptidase domain-containing protein [Chromobacterium haemolyticum]MDH0342133.1 zincin-like metallopeptidase domain-containing protein [Chromobacterium haemolyticum]
MAVIRRLVAPQVQPVVSTTAVEPETTITAPPQEMREPASSSPTSGQEKSGGSRGKSRGGFTPRDLYQEVTDRIVEAIENGTAPWQQMWDGQALWPLNGSTTKPYHGINVMLLAGAGYQDPRWCSYQQAKDRGWQVKRDEHGTKIYFYKPLNRKTGEIDPETQEPETKTIPILKSYTVFNFSQIEGVPELERRNAHAREVDDLTEQICQELVDATGADIVYGQRRAAYSPSQDRVYMPDKESFESDAHFYTTLLHELSHWTGHTSRLKREFGPDRNSEQYAREELRAEMASAMLSLRLGLPSKVDGHSAYVDHYLKILRNDKKEIFRAAKDAERMARYVLSFHPEFREEFEAEHQAQMVAHIEAGGPEEIFDASDFDFETDDLLLMGAKP